MFCVKGDTHTEFNLLFNALCRSCNVLRKLETCFHLLDECAALANNIIVIAHWRTKSRYMTFKHFLKNLTAIESCKHDNHNIILQVVYSSQNWVILLYLTVPRIVNKHGNQLREVLY